MPRRVGIRAYLLAACTGTEARGFDPLCPARGRISLSRLGNLASLAVPSRVEQGRAEPCWVGPSRAGSCRAETGRAHGSLNAAPQRAFKKSTKILRGKKGKGRVGASRTGARVEVCVQERRI